MERDLEAAKTAFGTAAFRNEAILQQPCAGYIDPQRRTSETERRLGVERFLRDFMPADPVASLAGALDSASAVAMALQSGDRVVNDPEGEGFVLAEFTKSQIATGSFEIGERLEDSLRSQLPDEFYASFIPIGGGVVYFFWLREGQAWRILHASLVCM